MPFIIVFNIIVCVVCGAVLLTILGCAVAAKDCLKKPAEEAQKIQRIIGKVKFVAYIVFLSVVVLMIIINLIF